MVDDHLAGIPIPNSRGIIDAPQRRFETIVILGSGPIRIGQAAEFDFPEVKRVGLCEQMVTKLF